MSFYDRMEFANDCYSFALGDVVRYVGSKDSLLQFDGKKLIEDITMEPDGDLLYSVDGKGDWFCHDELKLVKRATPKTLKKLKRMLGLGE